MRVFEQRIFLAAFLMVVLVVVIQGSPSCLASELPPGVVAAEQPVAADDWVTTHMDHVIDIDVLGNDYDPDGNALSVVCFTQGTHGYVFQNHYDTLTYTPKPSFTGVDTFSYTISNDQGGTAIGVVSVNVIAPAPSETPETMTPLAVDDVAETLQGIPISIAVLANDQSSDGSDLIVLSVTQGVRGSVEINADNSVTYTPAGSFVGTDTFTYTVSDKEERTSTATVTVAITLPPEWCPEELPISPEPPDGEQLPKTRAVDAWWFAVALVVILVGSLIHFNVSPDYA